MPKSAHNLQGFWSYVHKDDEADGGRIVRLAHDVTNQYEMLTGEAISLFLDKDALEWGDSWRDKIEANLASVAFFIPVMTPRYFMSSECRLELQFFARRLEKSGVKGLVLPLLYVDIPSFDGSADQDDLIALVKTFQYEDWREIRFLDVASEGYRRGVAQLAKRLAFANKQAEESGSTSLSLSSDDAIEDGEEDVSPGIIDRIAGVEEALPQWTETLRAISREIDSIGSLMQEATLETKQGGGAGRKEFVHRLTVARQLARQLSEPTSRVLSLANDFASKLHEVDDGFRAIVEQAAEEIGEGDQVKSQFCQFFETVRSLSRSAYGGLTGAEQMIEAIAPIEKMSRDLRPVLRTLRQGLTVLVEAREVTDGWVSLIDRSGIDCIAEMPTN